MTHTEGPRRGPTNHSRGSKGQSPERPTDARRLLIYRPLVGRTKRIYSSSPTSRQGRSFPPYTHLCPPQSFGALLLRLGAMIRPTASGRSAIVICRLDRQRTHRSCVPTGSRLAVSPLLGDVGGRSNALMGTDALRLDTSRASLQRGTRLVAYSIVSW